MKEGTDYFIMPIGKVFEMASLTLAGFAAGIVELTKRGYKINFKTVTTTLSLHTAKTLPKTSKKKKITKKEVKKGEEKE